VSEMSPDEYAAPPRRQDRFAWSQRALDGVLVVSVLGEVDLATEEPLRALLADLTDRAAAARVVLDLAGVRFIDAHSIGMIAMAAYALEQRGRTLRIRNLTCLPEKLLGVLGLEPLLLEPPRGDELEGGARARRGGCTRIRWEH
jgi:anti-anti-sigma factor